jgi:nucleoside-diphosphate-sugar epimerase
MKVAITGSNGVVGGTLAKELNPELFTIIPIDLPEVDASDYSSLAEATVEADVLIHLAWKDLVPNVLNNTRDPVNMQMVRNAYEAAVANHIPRVIMGSSNQAHGYDVRDDDGRIRPTTLPDQPTNEYGREKLQVEAMGLQYATEKGLEVVCLRIGNVNKEDMPKDTTDGRPQRWLSKYDLGRLVTACILKDEIPSGFQVIYGVSNGSVFDWVNTVGYSPVDDANNI